MIRSEQSLSRTLMQIDYLNDQSKNVAISDYREVGKALSLDKMLTAARMIFEVAAKRKESRGVHYREDYPNPDDENWLKNIIIAKKGDGMTLSTVPVKLSDFAN